MRISDWSSDVCSSDLEDAHHVLLVLLVELLRALPVDVEQEILPFLEPSPNPPLGRAVTVPENVSPFVEIVFRDHAVEFSVVDEMIVHAVNLARARRARGDRKSVV